MGIIHTLTAELVVWSLHHDHVYSRNWNYVSMATAAAADCACVAGVPVSTSMNDVQPCTIVHYTAQHLNCLYAEPKCEKETIHCILITFILCCPPFFSQVRCLDVQHVVSPGHSRPQTLRLRG